MASNSYEIYPTLIQCFGVILIGYLTGRFNFITQTQGKGISLFISTIALPALIFKALVEVEFQTVNWNLWFGILISKSILFFVVLVVTLVFQKKNQYGAAGLYGIFVTNSNDIAFGLPLLTAVFNTPETRPLINYIFLVVPVSLAILNPIGFIFLEYQKAVNKTKSEISILRILLVTSKGLVTNPLVFMILFGIVGNFAFNQKIPVAFDGLFTCLGSAFDASALFYLGWKLGSQQAKLRGMQYSVPIVLILMKGLFLPIIMLQIVTALTEGCHSQLHKASFLNSTFQNKTSTAIKMYAFLYGAVPTAPTVMVYASKYNMFQEVIGTGLIWGTLFSAPVIYASVQILKVHDMMADAFDKTIGDVASVVSIASVVFCVHTFFILSMTKMYRRLPHFYSMVLVFYQFILGLIGSFFNTIPDRTSVMRIPLFFLYVGLFGSSLCCILICICLILMATHRESLLKKWNCWMFVTSILIPLLLSAGIIFFTSRGLRHTGASYYFLFHCFREHRVAAALYTVLNSITLIVCVATFVCLKRSDYLQATSIQENRESESLLSIYSCQRYGSNISENSNDSGNSTKDVTEIENRKLEKMISKNKHWNEHVVILLIMSIIILVNLVITIWENVNSGDDLIEGIYLEFRMLTVVLTYGQGFFTFAVFGFMREFFTLPIFERFQFFWLSCQGRKKVCLRSIEELPRSVIVNCEMFIKHHIHSCSKDIVRDLRFRFRTYKGVFEGNVLVDWLVEAGLVSDRVEAKIFGNNLLDGRVIEHCLKEHRFYDLPYFYQFTDNALNVQNHSQNKDTYPNL